MSSTYKEHKIKNSVGYKLLRVVFSFYVLIALIVTAAHMFSEYKNAKKIIFEDMLNVENSFKRQLANSVWHFDNELITEVIHGVLATRTIIGVTIKSEDDNSLTNAGTIDIKNRNSNSDLFDVKYKDNLYIHSFELSSKSYNNGEKLGIVHLYSDDTVIYNIVKNNFLLIIINSLIKTLALWFIFLYFSKKYLTKPFYEMIKSTSDINFGKMKTLNFSNKFRDKSEFEVLETSYNSMLLNLNHSYIELQNANKLNIELNKTLESKVFDRTHELEESNNELEQTIYSLKQTQEQLIQSEKMASLAALVTGVAHEINTPVGTSLTAITHLNDSAETIQKLYNKNEVSEEEFNEFLQLTKQISDSITVSLQQTSKLIASFKSIAADKSNDVITTFNLKNYLSEILISHSNKMKQKNVQAVLNCSEYLDVETYPGAVFQIFSNLIMNSLNHGFIQHEKGEISIDVIENTNSINIIYKDNGKGIQEDILPKIFDPFFTTSRKHGGAGLGLNMIYNTITSQMHGDISCESSLGEGVTFTMSFYNFK